MNTVVSTTPGRSDQSTHPPQPEPPSSTAHAVVRRVGLLDRLALHLGVALVAWSRRPLRVSSRDVESWERRATLSEQRFAQLQRELAAESWRVLRLPRL